VGLRVRVQGPQYLAHCLEFDVAEVTPDAATIFVAVVSVAILHL